MDNQSEETLRGGVLSQFSPLLNAFLAFLLASRSGSQQKHVKKMMETFAKINSQKLAK